MIDINLEIYNDAFWTQFKDNSNVFETIQSYIDNYPGLSKIFILTEENYIDKDFIIDYSNYYARCFKDIVKKTKRYHFFFAEKKEEILDLFYSIFGNNRINESLKKLNSRYLGFLVKKELENGCIGRTILKKYPRKVDQNSERVLNVACINKINIFGIPLEIDTLPFQEQDGGVSACATMAIWSALRALSDKFNISIPYAPSEITSLAFEEKSLISSPKFPNEGLNIHQIISVFSKLGYNIISYSDVEDNEFLSQLFRSHLNYGIPLIGLLEFEDDSFRRDYHAVTISGYKLDNLNDSITQLYVHDDQVGPYSKVNFQAGKLWEWNYDWFVKRETLRKIKMAEVLVPLYPKIRQTFTAVYEKTYLHMQNKYHLKNSDLRIYLDDVNSYKWDLITKIIPIIKNKTNPERVLNKSFPKHIWVLRLKEKDIPAVDFIFDATNHNLSMHECIEFF
jgi:hypothetical protein